LLDATTVSDSLNLKDPRVIACGDVGRSMAAERMRRTDKSRMPPLASAVPDHAALDVVVRWIESEATLPSQRRKR
jgi:hypothetical protein